MALPKRNYLPINYHYKFFLGSDEDKSKLQPWLGGISMLVTSKFSKTHPGLYSIYPFNWVSENQNQSNYCSQPQIKSTDNSMNQSKLKVNTRSLTHSGMKKLLEFKPIMWCSNAKPIIINIWHSSKYCRASDWPYDKYLGWKVHVLAKCFT